MDLDWREEVLKYAIGMFPLQDKPEDAPVLLLLLKEYSAIKNIVDGSFDDYRYHRDSAEAYLLTGQIDIALEHAVSCNDLCPEYINNRKDIIAKIRFFKKDILGGLEAINEYDGLGKKRTLDLVKYILLAYDNKIDIKYLKTKYEVIFKYVNKHFGNWETAVFNSQNHNISTFPTQPIDIKESSYYNYRFNEVIKDAEKSLNELIIKNNSLRTIYALINEKKYSKSLELLNNDPESNEPFMIGLKSKILYQLGEFDSIISQNSISRTYYGREYYLKAKLQKNISITSKDILNFSILNIGIDFRIIENYKPFIIKIIEKKVGDFEVSNNISVNDYFLQEINNSNFLEVISQFSAFVFDNIKEEIKEEVGDDVKWIREYTLYKYIEETFCNYEIIKHHRPNWLTPQHLDIFIPQFSLAIEYNGLQHYQPVEYFGGEEGFINNLNRDSRKKTLCEINKVNLLIVKYDQDFDEVIEELKKRYLE